MTQSRAERDRDWHQDYLDGKRSTPPPSRAFIVTGGLELIGMTPEELKAHDKAQWEEWRETDRAWKEKSREEDLARARRERYTFFDHFNEFLFGSAYADSEKKRQEDHTIG